MSDRIVFRSLPEGGRWKVTRDDKLIGRYPHQSSAQNAAARLARGESRKGSAVLAVFHKSDGSPKLERTYDKVQGAWLHAGR